MFSYFFFPINHNVKFFLQITLHDMPFLLYPTSSSSCTLRSFDAEVLLKLRKREKGTLKSARNGTIRMQGWFVILNFMSTYVHLYSTLYMHDFNKYGVTLINALLKTEQLWMSSIDIRRSFVYINALRRTAN